MEDLKNALTHKLGFDDRSPIFRETDPLLGLRCRASLILASCSRLDFPSQVLIFVASGGRDTGSRA